jgi:hypothetical protein
VKYSLVRTCLSGVLTFAYLFMNKMEEVQLVWIHPENLQH